MSEVHPLRFASITASLHWLKATRLHVYRRAYYASISYTDYNIGMILRKLEAVGLNENTITIVFGAGLLALHFGFAHTRARISLSVSRPSIL